jgi:hypothetical protein
MEQHGIDDHRRSKPPELIALFDRLLALVRACGPLELEPTRVGVTFHGTRRIFGSAKFGRTDIRGHLVLPERVEDDPRFVTIELLTKTLYFHGFRLNAETDLDAGFRRRIEQAHRSGCGDQRAGPPA